MPRYLRSMALVAVLTLGSVPSSGCDDLECEEDRCAGERTADDLTRRCADDPQCVPRSGEAYLLSRSAFDDYEAATFSFEHATWYDAPRVRNDWDLLFGNDRLEISDELRVNTVTDDRSQIVDLGALPFSEIPATVEEALARPGVSEEVDLVTVHLGHVYLVRTLDGDTRQYAAFRVVAHQLNESVTLRWYRSPDPDRFVY